MTSLNSERGLAAYARMNDTDWSSVVKRCQRTQFWTEEYANRVLNEYKRLLAAKIATFDTLDTKILPPLALNAMWREHILDTRLYKEHMQQFFGNRVDCLHHNPDIDTTAPVEGNADAATSRSRRIQTTRSALFLLFGDDHPLPEDIWDYGNLDPTRTAATDTAASANAAADTVATAVRNRVRRRRVEEDPPTRVVRRRIRTSTVAAAAAEAPPEARATVATRRRRNLHVLREALADFESNGAMLVATARSPYRTRAATTRNPATTAAAATAATTSTVNRPPEMLVVYVQRASSDQRIGPIHITQQTSVRDFRNVLQAMTGHPAGEQRIIYRGRELLDHQRLEHYQVEQNSILHLVVPPHRNTESTAAAAATSDAAAVPAPASAT